MQKEESSVLVMQPWLSYRGAETLSIFLTEDLNQQGFKSRLLCLYVSPGAEEIVSKQLLILPHIFFQRLSRNRIFFVLFGFWILLFLTLLRGRDFEVYNAHNFPTMWVAVIVARLYGKKVVWSTHSFPQHPFRRLIGFVYDLLTGPVDRFLARKVDVVTAVSYQLAEKVLNLYDRQAEVIYPGVDTTFFLNSKLARADRFGIPVESKILLQVGQVREEKNQQFSVEVFGKALEEYPNLVLVFAGDKVADYPAIDSAEVVKQVYFLGRLSKRELAYLYSIADVLIFPSVWGEGFGLSVLECMTVSDCMVFAARGCGADEVLRDEQVGYVFNLEGGSEVVGRKLVKVLGDSERNAKHSAIAEKYSRARFSEDYIRLFKRMNSMPVRC